jgi:AraC family transcriptional regulator of adaptative response / DNA-3-methyladenine glycosylase II
MLLDRKQCYSAVSSRDPRFDGRFFIGVRTTGIYCRPVCPARTPLIENVRFFACAAAAEEAGFRPCRRCRPETAPGTPAWNGTSATIARALRLIGEGVMDERGVDSLAERLGIGGRHLRRLFSERLGASPIAIARTRRTHFAYRLIIETDMPISQIAFASGFGSLRRFNAAIREAFAASPTALRRSRTKDPRKMAREEAEGLVLRLAYRPPYDWDSILRFLAQRAIPGIEEVVEGAYRRSVVLADHPGMIEVRHSPEGNGLLLRVGSLPSSDLMRVVERVRRQFDLDADPIPIASSLERDPVLSAAIAKRPGLRVPGAWDPFEIAVRAVIGQQVSVAGARTLAGRLVRACGEVLPNASGSVTHLFPTPEAVARADLGTIGVTRARSSALRALSIAIRDHAEILDPSRGLEETIERLKRIRGIGPWTAGYIAMRGLGEPDAIPFGDLGLRRALGDATMQEVEIHAERWRPWRAYATVHVWHPEFEGTQIRSRSRSRSGRRKG